MRYQGTIASWKDDQGFGFIVPEGDGRQVFVHIKSFPDRQRRPIENDLVTYELGTDPQGRARAERVAFAGERLPWITSSRPRSISLTFAGLFVLVLAGAAVIGKVPLPILGFYFIASIVAFVAYALDKSAARQGHWRTQESTLHFLGLIGGWPGASAAQSLLRHKTKKQSFQVVFWITVALNCGALCWLLSPSGAAVLRTILGIAGGRSFTSFREAADEAGRSRNDGGIHFAFDDAAGLAAGRAIGNYVAAQILQPRSDGGGD